MYIIYIFFLSPAISLSLHNLSETKLTKKILRNRVDHISLSILFPFLSSFKKAHTWTHGKEKLLPNYRPVLPENLVSSCFRSPNILPPLFLSPRQYSVISLSPSVLLLSKLRHFPSRVNLFSNS